MRSNQGPRMSHRNLAIFLVLLAALALPGCDAPSEQDLLDSNTPRVRVFFNYTGTQAENGLDPEVDDIMIQMIDRAQSTIDFAIMGFSRRPVIEAMVRAHLRGVRLRFVGDARHMEGGAGGYLEMDRYNIPMISGNQFHIMHNKFFIIDDRWVITGTGNITTTGFEKNNNNYVAFDSPPLAADFKVEFEQMFNGRFGNAKVPIDNGRTYPIGDTTTEVFFSPQEDAMGRMLQGIEEAQESVYFMIFAFTKDQVGSALVQKHREFSRYNQCCDPARVDERDAECATAVTCVEPFRRKEVRGAIDRSQLHSNGPYHEYYRLALFGVPMRLDGNDNSFQPGDYQAGGGRLHSKTMVVDAGTPTAKVLTGSFNWSSSATIANDETFLVLNGERVTNEHLEYFESLWQNSKEVGVDYAGKGDGKVLPSRVEDGQFIPGSIIFNEVHWDGYNGKLDPSDFGGDCVSNDQFIELLNTTDQPIDMSLWVLGTNQDFTVGFYPGTVVGPHERFLILDHNLTPYTDTNPQDEPHAFQNADFVMNTANDPRFLRLNLHNATLALQLVDARGTVIDVAGDGSPPFAGGRVAAPMGSTIEFCEDFNGPLLNFSMERLHPPGPGDATTSWAACNAAEGGVNVREEFRSLVIATPGEPNSNGTTYPEEAGGFRTPN